MTLPANVTRFLFEVIGLGDQLRVLSFRIEEHLAEPFRAWIGVAVDNSALDFDSAVGKPAVLTLFDERSPRLLHGEVFSIQQGESGKKFTHYWLEIVPKFEFLKYRAGARIFQDKSVPDIISQVLTEANIKPPHVKLQLTQGYGPRTYCVQYQETEFHFLSRLMEEEGLFYYFEHHLDKHVMVITDSATTCKPIQGDKKIGFHSKTGLVSDKFSIHQFNYAVSNAPGKVTLNDFDFEKPKLNLEKNHQQGKMGSLESYEYPGQYKNPGDGKRYTTINLQSQQALAIEACGQTDDHNLEPGYRFDLKDYPRGDFNREYLVLGVKQEGEQPQSLDEGATGCGTTYALNFQAIPSDTDYRAPLRHPKRKTQGSQSAIVCGPPGEEIYTDKFGRIKLQFHWDREGQYNEKSSCWVRVSQSWAGKQWGTVVLPRVGQEVLVQFLNGDPDQPIVTGRVYHGKNPPPYALPANKTRTTFKTLSTPKGKGYHELRIEDKKGSEQIYLHAEKDLEVRVKNDHKEWIGNDSHHQVNKSRQAKIGKDEHVYIEGNLNQEIGKSLSRNIGKESHTDIKKNLKAQAQTLHLKAGIKVVVQAGVELTLKGGAGFIKMDPSGVTIQGPMVRINTGCSASAAQGASPTSPGKTIEPVKAFTGFVDVPGIPTPPPPPVKIPFKSGVGVKVKLEPEVVQAGGGSGTGSKSASKAAVAKEPVATPVPAQSPANPSEKEKKEYVQKIAAGSTGDASRLTESSFKYKPSGQMKRGHKPLPKDVRDRFPPREDGVERVVLKRAPGQSNESFLADAFAEVGPNPDLALLKDIESQANEPGNNYVDISEAYNQAVVREVDKFIATDFAQTYTKSLEENLQYSGEIGAGPGMWEGAVALEKGKQAFLATSDTAPKMLKNDAKMQLAFDAGLAVAAPTMKVAGVATDALNQARKARKAAEAGTQNLTPGKLEKLQKSIDDSVVPGETPNASTVLIGKAPDSTFSQSAVKHSNIGDFPSPGNPKKNPFPSSMSGGGHGQANIEYLEEIGMKYNIERTFENGVRVGNVPQHKHKIKKKGLGQSWFPEKWTETDIKAAGEYVVNNTKDFDKVADGVPVYGTYKNVRVGVIKTNGQPATVFPDGSKQPSLKTKDFWEVILN